MLIIRNIDVTIDQKKIIQNFNITIDEGQVHSIMGPNGSGKSSLALTVMGHPRYTIDSGDIVFKGQSIIKLSPDKRAQLGLYLSFQHPIEIPGVPIFTFLKESYQALEGNIDSVSLFTEQILQLLDLVGLPRSFLNRNLNEGFSGGEKKRFELLQLLLFKPQVAFLDEIDSGIDVDGLRTLAQVLVEFKRMNPQSSLIFITHYPHILNYVVPDFVHIMINGSIVQSGTVDLAHSIQRIGYSTYV